MPFEFAHNGTIAHARPKKNSFFFLFQALAMHSFLRLDYRSSDITAGPAIQSTSATLDSGS